MGHLRTIRLQLLPFIPRKFGLYLISNHFLNYLYVMVSVNSWFPTRITSNLLIQCGKLKTGLRNWCNNLTGLAEGGGGRRQKIAKSRLYPLLWNIIGKNEQVSDGNCLVTESSGSCTARYMSQLDILMLMPTRYMSELAYTSGYQKVGQVLFFWRCKINSGRT